MRAWRFGIAVGRTCVAGFCPLRGDIKPSESAARAKDWCGWRDSNPHTLRRQDLNLLRLPIPPHPHMGSGAVRMRDDLSPDALYHPFGGGQRKNRMRRQGFSANDSAPGTRPAGKCSMPRLNRAAPDTASRRRSSAARFAARRSRKPARPRSCGARCGLFRSQAPLPPARNSARSRT